MRHRQHSTACGTHHAPTQSTEGRYYQHGATPAGIKGRPRRRSMAVTTPGSLSRQLQAIAIEWQRTALVTEWAPMLLPQLQRAAQPLSRPSPLPLALLPLPGAAALCCFCLLQLLFLGRFATPLPHTPVLPPSGSRQRSQPSAPHTVAPGRAAHCPSLMRDAPHFTQHGPQKRRPCP